MLRVLLPALVSLAFVVTVTASDVAEIKSGSNNDGEVPTETVAVKRGLKYVSEAGETWIRKRGCVSCHQVPTLIWSHSLARSAGMDESTRELDRWIDWSTDVVNFVKPAQKADVDRPATMAANIDTMVQLLLAIPRSEPPQPWRSTFVNALTESQHDDGSWKACGQLPMGRRPKRETAAVTTMWAMLALRRENADFNESSAEAFVSQVQSPVSTEFFTVRSLLAHEHSGEVSTAIEWLVERQNPDGGWGWRIAEPSDALGTGLALHALHRVTLDANPAAKHAAEAATRFLLTTQRPDGSWPVPGTKTSAKGRVTETAVDWGSAWAVMGLLAKSSDRD